MSGTQVTSDAELARLLGVDRALVSRDKRRGMPTNTLEAAVDWRQRNLRARIRGPTRNELQLQKRQAEDAAIRKVAQLMQLGHSALEAGHFHLVADEVRAALRAVPESARNRVGLAVDVMDKLCEHISEALDASKAAADDGAQNLKGPAIKMGGPEDPRSPFMARFWYAVAAGEDLDSFAPESAVSQG